MALSSSQLLKPKTRNHPWLLFPTSPCEIYRKILSALPPKHVLSPPINFLFYHDHPSFCLTSLASSPTIFPLLTIFQPPGLALCTSNSHSHFYLLEFLFPLSGMLFFQILALPVSFLSLRPWFKCDLPPKDLKQMHGVGGTCFFPGNCGRVSRSNMLELSCGMSPSCPRPILISSYC